jgi:predicted ArsR family transcriptional regulator
MCKTSCVDVATPSEDALRNPTRGRLFGLLAERRQAIATDELARSLGLHVNGVRRHLELLHSAGLVERRRVIRGRGRPRDEWSISPAAEPAGEPPEGYTELSRWLSRAIPERDIEEVERVGREIGREIAPAGNSDLQTAFVEALSAMGFRPSAEPTTDGFVCSLGNCPYVKSVRESPGVVCALHRGLTAGMIAQIDPTAELSSFEPRDPDSAGCLVGVTVSPASVRVRG